MDPRFAFFPLLAPLALAAAAATAWRQPGVRPRRVLAATRLAAAAGLLMALCAAGVTAWQGPVTSPLLGAGGFGISVRLDGLSTVMFALVAVLGAAVLRFSRNYLDGDARHGAFLGRLALTVAAVMVLVLAGNVAQLAAAWIAASLALHQLLVFYPDRPGALVAARKKFWVARLGDACLVAAAVLIARAFGTTDVATIADRAAAVGAAPAGIGLAAVLLVATAALKSAQFPTHGWLAEVMETPTPVSALLHAGILNGGTFLVARLASVALLSPTALALMVVVGGFTAVFASVVMITQTSVKVSLAYSSAAHMGFMLLVCGVGAYPVAVLHLVAHSFYKAHAFLSSGSAVEVARASKVPGHARTAPGALPLLASLGVAVATVVGVGALCGVTLAGDPVALALAAILAIGLTHLLAQVAGNAGAGVTARIALAAAGTAFAFFALERGAARVLAGAVPHAPHPGTLTLALAAAVVVVFAAASLAQLLLPSLGAGPRWAALYVHVRNGLYANALFDRIVGLPRAPRRALNPETRR